MPPLRCPTETLYLLNSCDKSRQVKLSLWTALYGRSGQSGEKKLRRGVKVREWWQRGKKRDEIDYTGCSLQHCPGYFTATKAKKKYFGVLKQIHPHTE